MDTRTVTLFLALLAVVAEVGVVTALVAAATGRWSVLAEVIGPQAIPLALLVAAVSTAGSLYFSEAAHFTPCRLCWIQRACMYPQVVLLALSGWRPRRDLTIASAVLAAAGLLVAGYHILVERFPNLE